eukprot:CFRG8604T1
MIGGQQLNNSGVPSVVIGDHRTDSDIQLALQTELKVLAAALAIETSALHLHNEHHNASSSGATNIEGLSNLLDQLVNVCTVSRLAEDLDAGVDNVIYALTEMSHVLLTTVSNTYVSYGGNGGVGSGNVLGDVTDIYNNGLHSISAGNGHHGTTTGSGGSSGRVHGHHIPIIDFLHTVVPHLPMWFNGTKRFNSAFQHVHALLDRHSQGRPIDLQSLNDGLFAIRDACDVCYELMASVPATSNTNSAMSALQQTTGGNSVKNMGGNGNLSSTSNSQNHPYNEHSLGSSSGKNGGMRRPSLSSMSPWENTASSQRTSSSLQSHTHQHHNSHSQTQQQHVTSEANKMWGVGPSLLFSPPPTPEDATSPTMSGSNAHRNGSHNGSTKSLNEIVGNSNTTSGSAGSKGSSGMSSSSSAGVNVGNDLPSVTKMTSPGDTVKAAFESAPVGGPIGSLTYRMQTSEQELVGHERNSSHGARSGNGGHKDSLGLADDDDTNSTELLSSDLINALDDETTEDDGAFAFHGDHSTSSLLHHHERSGYLPRGSQRGQQHNKPTSFDMNEYDITMYENSSFTAPGARCPQQSHQKQRNPHDQQMYNRTTRPREGSGSGRSTGGSSSPVVSARGSMQQQYSNSSNNTVKNTTNVIGGFRNSNSSGGTTNANQQSMVVQQHSSHQLGNEEIAMENTLSVTVDGNGFTSASAPASVVGSPDSIRRVGFMSRHHMEGSKNGSVGGGSASNNPSIVHGEFEDLEWYGSSNIQAVNVNLGGSVMNTSMSSASAHNSAPGAPPAPPTMSAVAAAAASLPNNNNIGPQNGPTSASTSSSYPTTDSTLPWKERPTGFRVVMCRHMDSKGKCKKAGTCTFAHSQASLEKFRALYIPTEKCNYGAKCAYRNAGGCRYSHTPLEQHKSIKVYNSAVTTSMKSKADS